MCQQVPIKKGRAHPYYIGNIKRVPESLEKERESSYWDPRLSMKWNKKEQSTPKQPLDHTNGELMYLSVLLC